MLLLQLLDRLCVLLLPLRPPAIEGLRCGGAHDLLVNRRKALPDVVVDDQLADSHAFMDAGRVVIFPEVLEAETQVLHATDPFGAIDDAALRGGHDLAARKIHGRHPHPVPDLGGHAGLPALEALEIGKVLDRTLEPAERLWARR